MGGSGLYINAAVDRMEFPGTDPHVRARWEAQLRQGGRRGASQIPGNAGSGGGSRDGTTQWTSHRSGVEVIELTGKPYNAGLGVPESFIPTIRIGLRRSRPELDDLIAAQVENMWNQGWVQEVRQLLAAGLAEAPRRPERLATRISRRT